jgi:hypothetical protein
MFHIKRHAYMLAGQQELALSENKAPGAGLPLRSVRPSEPTRPQPCQPETTRRINLWALSERTLFWSRCELAKASREAKPRWNCLWKLTSTGRHGPEVSLAAVESDCLLKMPRMQPRSCIRDTASQTSGVRVEALDNAVSIVGCPSLRRMARTTCMLVKTVITCRSMQGGCDHASVPGA